MKFMNENEKLIWIAAFVKYIDIVDPSDRWNQVNKEPVELNSAIKAATMASTVVNRFRGVEKKLKGHDGTDTLEFYEDVLDRDYF